MRYADGPTVEVEVRVEAPASRVWEFVTDIELPKDFSSEFLGATWLDDGPALGARFVGRNRHEALGEWETTSFVVRYEPPRWFEWAVSDAEEPSTSWWFSVEALGDAVVLRQGTRFGPGRSGLNIAIDAMPDKEERIIARRLQEHERNMQATVEGVKRLAESPAGP